jgi:hypothetical protein
MHSKTHSKEPRKRAQNSLKKSSNRTQKELKNALKRELKTHSKEIRESLSIALKQLTDICVFLWGEKEQCNGHKHDKHSKRPPKRAHPLSPSFSSAAS